jgi:thymidine kinase
MEYRPMICMCVGDMFAGKTQWLIDQYNTRRGVAVAIKPEIDKRFHTDKITSHRFEMLSDGAMSRCEISIPAITGTTMRECMEKVRADPSLMWPNVLAICVDEGQFFPDLVEECLALVESGRTVYVSALKATAKNEPWPVVSRLIAHADEVVVSYASSCSVCGYWRAPHTRVKPSMLDGAGALIRIGGSDIYEAVCRRCLQTPSPL